LREKDRAASEWNKASIEKTPSLSAKTRLDEPGVEHMESQQVAKVKKHGAWAREMGVQQ